MGQEEEVAEPGAMPRCPSLMRPVTRKWITGRVARRGTMVTEVRAAGRDCRDVGLAALDGAMVRREATSCGKRMSSTHQSVACPNLHVTAFAAISSLVFPMVGGVGRSRLWPVQ